MNFKKIMAAALSAAMVLTATAIPAFAAGPTLALSVSKTAVAAGDTFTVTLPMDSTNITPVQSISVTLTYDDEALEYISATSEFFAVTSNNTTDEGNSTADGEALISGHDVTGTKTTGNIMVANFRVKSTALGGIKNFTVSDIAISNQGAEFIASTSGATVTASSVEVKAPVQLEKPVVTNADKKAAWSAIANAVTYNVALKKGSTEIYNKDQSATEFDFSKYVTETAEYTVIVTANQNTSMYLASEPSEPATTNYVVDSKITPTSKDYVKGSDGFEVTMTLNGNTLTKIDDGTNDLTSGTDYVVTGNVVKIKDSVLETSKTLTFTFSAGAVATVGVTVKDAANAATLVLAEREKTDNSYPTDDTVANEGTTDGLIIVTNGVNPVTNFIGAQFTVTNTADTNCDVVEYDIVPADGFALNYDADADIYEINVKPVNGVTPSISENPAGKGIVIGKLVRKGTGYGKGTIKAGNITITVEKSDNSYATLSASSFDFLYNIPEPVEKLNVNVDFGKLPTTTANAAAYQNMKINLYSARLGNIELALGNNDGLAPVYTSEDGKIKATLTSSDNKYVLALEGLPKFEAYTVSIKGDGYRDAKAQFVLNEETTVNFWNNANDSERIFISKVGGDTTMAKKNFLAGDIIMNNVIDLYDLSAVSSYYGKKGLTADDAQYIQYDLNRDGRVDIFDITMVLAGWAE